MKRITICLLISACDLLGPRVSDQTSDAPPGPSPDTATDAPTPIHLLPNGTPVPSVDENAELASQIRIFDGLSDSALMASGGVITRSTGKAAGVTVRFWNFGNARIIDGFVASSPLYVLADDDGAGNYTPRSDHPFLIDAIPGDIGYSAIRRVIYVPVTSTYAGERIPSIEALQEALDLGLVRDPVPAGTWRNMPVVPTTTKLEVSTGVSIDATEVYGRGYRVELIPLGGTSLGVQPLRNNQPPQGQESRLLSGVATGTPPVKPTTLDAQPVFQYGIPAVPPTTTFNYTPIVTEVDVRLANGIAPTAITRDNDLFTRATNGSITGYYTDNVESYVITTIFSNKQIQFVDGEP
ncbi:MAG: hypothetical protein ACKV2T_28890 [Kofleriaceae bacterium]